MWAIRSPKPKTRLSCVTTTTARSGRTAASRSSSMTVSPGFVVERGGRLVADQEARLVDQGPRDRHPLHLAAGELAGQAVELLAHAERRQHLAGPADGPLLRPAGDHQGDRRVLGGRERGQQVVLLKHKADVLSAEAASAPGRSSSSARGRRC